MNKNNFFVLLFLILLTACQTDKPVEQKSTIKKNAKVEVLPLVKNSSKTLDVPWIAIYNDSTQLLEIKKNPTGNPKNLNEQDLIDALNLKYPEIKLEAVTRVKNTSVVKISNASYLTNEMGSTGARSYLAEATYSLTEVPGINAIEFRFTQGNHAMPGVFTRKSFENFN